jgi:hypothetical protein
MRVQCAKCSRPLAVTDAVQLVDGRLAHVECNRPSTLTPEERQLVFVHCSDHDVAHCDTCDISLRFARLGADVLGGRTNMCPRCRQNLTERVRAHLFGCEKLPAVVRRRAQEVREAAQQLVKRSHQLVDRKDVLIREAEAELYRSQQALRAAMAQRATAGPTS